MAEQASSKVEVVTLTGVLAEARGLWVKCRFSSSSLAGGGRTAALAVPGVGLGVLHLL